MMIFFKFKRMAPRVLFFVFVSLITLSVKGQEDPGEIGSDSLINYDSLDSMDDISLLFTDTCRHAAVSFFVPVYYAAINNNEVRAVVQISEPGEFPYQYKLYDVTNSGEENTISGSAVLDNNGYLSYNMLIENRKYVLKSNSTCGQEFSEILSFETRRDTAPVAIDVSNKIMNAFAAWPNHPVYKDSSLFAYLETFTDIHYLEKTALIQAWIYKNVKLPIVINPSADYTIVGPAPQEMPKLYQIKAPIVLGPCICQQFQLNLSAAAREGNYLSNGGTDIVSSGEVMTDYTDHRTKKHLKQLGVSKHISFLMEDYNGSDKRTRSCSNNVNYTQLTISYMCVDQNANLSACGCKRSYSMRYAYDAFLNPYVSIRGGKNSNREASTIAEDWISVSFLNQTTGDFEILDVKHAGIYATTKVNTNKNFYLGILSAAKDLVSAVGNFKGGNTIPALQDILNSMSTMVTLGPPASSSANGGGDEYEARGERVKDLPANEVHTYLMTNSYYIENSGYNKYIAQSSILSDCILAIKTYGGVDPLEPGCCGSNTAIWASGSIDWAPSSYDDLQEEMMLFFSPHNFGGNSRIRPTTACGHSQAPAMPNCPTLLDVSYSMIANPESKQLVAINVSDGDLYLISKAHDSVKLTRPIEIEYEVVTPTGQILTKGYICEGKVMIVDRTVTRQYSVLFIRARVNGIEYSEKISIIK